MHFETGAVHNPRDRPRGQSAGASGAGSRFHPHTPYPSQTPGPPSAEFSPFINSPQRGPASSAAPAARCPVTHDQGPSTPPRLILALSIGGYPSDPHEWHWKALGEGTGVMSVFVYK